MMINARKLVKNVSDLPTIPEIVAKISAMLNNHESDPEEIADLILSDQVLAAKVIRAVNSPLYGNMSEITSMKKGLLYLGFSKVREIILTNSFIDAFKEHSSSFDMRQFWFHSFNVGGLSEKIANAIGFRDTEKAYLVGIIHDIGKVFLGSYHQQEYAEMLEAIKGQDYATYEAEVEVFNTTHCEVGLCLAEKWAFPPSYCDSISYHHTSEEATVDPLLTSIITIADFIALSAHSEQDARSSNCGRSEENAWKVIRQLSSNPPKDTLEQFVKKHSAEMAL